MLSVCSVVLRDEITTEHTEKTEKTLNKKSKISDWMTVGFDLGPRDFNLNLCVGMIGVLLRCDSRGSCVGLLPVLLVPLVLCFPWFGFVAC